MSMTVHPLVDGAPPAWATCWGDSKCGPWAAFMENHIVYKMARRAHNRSSQARVGRGGAGPVAPQPQLFWSPRLPDSSARY